MNWLERARREICGTVDRATADTDEANLTALTAVPALVPAAITSSIGSTGSFQTQLIEQWEIQSTHEPHTKSPENYSELNTADTDEANLTAVMAVPALASAATSFSIGSNGGTRPHQNNSSDTSPKGKTISDLMDALAEVHQTVGISQSDILKWLVPEDIKAWREGDISVDTLTAFARSLMQRQDMYLGNRPNDYTRPAICKRCGPIWLWAPGEFEGCPWCFNRANGLPIPRPQSVLCDNYHCGIPDGSVVGNRGCIEDTLVDVQTCSEQFALQPQSLSGLTSEISEEADNAR